jgi:EmrB/QacA subfamily drug resistance transporter
MTTTPVASRLGIVLAVCCLGQFMNVLDASVVNVALPSIVRQLGFDRHNLQWVSSAYTIAVCGCLLLGGRLADVYGQRRILLAGATLFTLASGIGGLAASPVTLIAARAFQGVGASVMAPATLTIIATTFTEPAARARAFGMWSVVAGAGGAVGVILSGILTEFTSWRWTLLINVPLGLVLVAGAYFGVPERAGHRDTGSLDVLGAALVTGGLLACVFGIAESSTYGWLSPPIVTTFAASAVLLSVFLVHQTRADNPLIPRGFFRDRGFSSAAVVALFSTAALFSTFYFFTLLLQQVLGYSPLQTGLSYLPMSIGISIGGYGVSGVVVRYGPRPILFSGLAMACAGLLWLSMADTSSFVSGLLWPGVLLGVGMGGALNATTNAATAGLRPEQAGLGSGVLNTMRQLGSALGLVVLVAAATSDTDAQAGGVAATVGALSSGYRLALALAALCAALAFAAAFAVPAHRRSSKA